VTFVLCRGQAHLVLTDRVFVGSEMPLEVGLDVARSRLDSLTRTDELLIAAQEAYGSGFASLVRAGDLALVPWAPRVVAVRFREPVAHGDSVLMALRWEAIAPGEGIFPALDADITLVADGDGPTLLRLAGAYRPPSGAGRAGIDQGTLHQIAAATLREFLGRLGGAVNRSAGSTASSPEQERSSMPPGAAAC